MKVFELSLQKISIRVLKCFPFDSRLAESRLTRVNKSSFLKAFYKNKTQRQSEWTSLVVYLDPKLKIGYFFKKS